MPFGGPATARLSKRTSPAVAGSSPLMILSSVDFPHPDGPITETKLPRAMPQVSPSNTVRSRPRALKTFVTARSSMMGVVAAGAALPGGMRVAVATVMVRRSWCDGHGATVMVRWSWRGGRRDRVNRHADGRIAENGHDAIMGENRRAVYRPPYRARDDRVARFTGICTTRRRRHPRSTTAKTLA